MGAPGVVKDHPVLDDAAGLEAIVDFFKVDGLLLQAAPQSFDEDVIKVAPAPVHGDAHTGLGQRCDPG